MPKPTRNPGHHDTHPLPSPDVNPSDDDTAEALIAAILALAVAVRDEPTTEVAAAARAVLAVADPVAALTVAAALIRVDAPVDAWWQRGLDGVGRGRVSPAVVRLAGSRPSGGCGTRAGFEAHRRAGEECEVCRVWMRGVWRERRAARRSAAGAGLGVAS